MPTSYKNTVLANTPAIYYQLDDTSSTAADSSGNARHGTYYGTYAQSQASLISSDLTGKCVDFDGSTGCILYSTNVHNARAGLSIEAWINADEIAGKDRMVAAFYGGGGFGYETLALRVNADGSVTVLSRPTNTHALVTMTYAGPLTTANRYHLVATASFSGNRMKLYVNSSEVQSSSPAGFTASASNLGGSGSAVRVATDYGGTKDFSGKIDEVAFYVTELAAADVTSHYNAGIAAPALDMPAPANVSVSGFAPGYSPVQMFVPVQTVSIDGTAPARFFWEAPANVSWQMVYKLTLTGAPDGQTDVVLPMASFQSRARAAAQTYIGAVVPYTAAYAQAIALRPHGVLVISAGPKYSDGTENLTVILRATLDRVDVDRGPRNGSITLHGYYAATTRPVQTRQMRGVSYVHTGNTNTIRCNVDIWLRPGDTAVDPTTGLSITADTITYVISPGRQEMTVADRGI